MRAKPDTVREAIKATERQERLIANCRENIDMDDYRKNLKDRKLKMLLILADK